MGEVFSKRGHMESANMGRLYPAKRKGKEKFGKVGYY